MKKKKNSSLWEELKQIIKPIHEAIIIAFITYVVICLFNHESIFSKESTNELGLPLLIGMLIALFMQFHRELNKNNSALDNFQDRFDKLFVFKDDIAMKIFESFDKRFAPSLLNRFLKIYSSEKKILYPDIEITHYSETLRELGELAGEVFYAFVGGNNTPDWFYNDTDLDKGYKLNYLKKTNQFSSNIKNAKRIMVFDEKDFNDSLNKMSRKQFGKFIKMHRNIKLYWYNKSNKNVWNSILTDEQRKIISNAEMGVFDNKIEISFIFNKNIKGKIMGDMQIFNYHNGNIAEIMKVLEDQEKLKLFDDINKIKYRFNQLHKV